MRRAGDNPVIKPGQDGELKQLCFADCTTEMFLKAEDRTERAKPRPSVGPASDSKFSNAELASMLRPRDDSSPFARVHDLSFLTSEPHTVSSGRHKDAFNSDYYTNNEDRWIDSVNKRIDNGDINESTLVVAITGHGPAIGWAMSQRLGSDVYMSLPKNLIVDHPGQNRPFEQAQTFFPGIRAGQMQGRHSVSTLLDFDLHQDKADPSGLASKLPSADEIRKLGFSKVFLATELCPHGTKPFVFRPPRPGYNHQPVIDWLERLRRSGIAVVTDGIDERGDCIPVGHWRP